MIERDHLSAYATPITWSRLDPGDGSPGGWGGLLWRVPAVNWPVFDMRWVPTSGTGSVGALSVAGYSPAELRLRVERNTDEAPEGEPLPSWKRFLAICQVSFPQDRSPERPEASRLYQGTIVERTAREPEYAIERVLHVAREAVQHRWRLEDEERRKTEHEDPAPGYSTAPWPPELLWVVQGLSGAPGVRQLTAADLPDTSRGPWTLKSTAPKLVTADWRGRSYSYYSQGGPFMKVGDNQQFLAYLRHDVQQGRKSPRWRTGAILNDLYALAKVIRGRSPANYGF